MAPSSLADLQRLHSRAQANLEEKLHIVPTRTMPSPPSIDDIYSESACPAEVRRRRDPNPLISISSIPKELQLPFLFSHYNAFTRTNCTARKEASQSVKLSRAIWYWDMDDSHSFSSLRDTIRYNIILMTLVGISANPNKYCKPETETFTEAFVLAWVESLQAEDCFDDRDEFLAIWKTGPWDLITFTDAQKQRINASFGSLREKMRGASELQNRLSEASDGFGRLFDTVPDAASALHWCFMYRGGTATHSTAESASNEYGRRFNVDGQASLPEESWFDLEHVVWKDPLVDSLLVGIDRAVINQGPSRKQQYPSWITADDAALLLEDECGGTTETLSALFGGLSMENGDGDAMEM